MKGKLGIELELSDSVIISRSEYQQFIKNQDIIDEFTNGSKDIIVIEYSEWIFNNIKGLFYAGSKETFSRMEKLNQEIKDNTEELMSEKNKYYRAEIELERLKKQDIVINMSFKQRLKYLFNSNYINEIPK